VPRTRREIVQALIERRNVVFPQPDGPMRAVIALRGIAQLTSCSAWVGPTRSCTTWTRALGGGRMPDGQMFLGRSADRRSADPPLSDSSEPSGDVRFRLFDLGFGEEFVVRPTSMRLPRYMKAV